MSETRTRVWGLYWESNGWLLNGLTSDRVYSLAPEKRRRFLCLRDALDYAASRALQRDIIPRPFCVLKRTLTTIKRTMRVTSGGGFEGWCTGGTSETLRMFAGRMAEISIKIKK